VTRLGDAPPADLLDPAERMSVDELRALQLDRLRWTLRHAYENVPFYKRSFDASGVHPDDCRDLTDLAKFPVTAKADLRENYPFGMFAVPHDRVRRIHASSGTTGKPTVRHCCPVRPGRPCAGCARSPAAATTCSSCAG
jgi:phenylacetate-CoA ligase